MPPTTYSLTLTRPRPRTHTHPRRVCIEGTYLLAGACVTACPAGMMSMGFDQVKPRCIAPLACQNGRIMGLDASQNGEYQACMREYQACMASGCFQNGRIMVLRRASYA